MNAVYMLWLRQLKRWARSKPRVIASLGQPLLYLLAMGFGFGPIFKMAGRGNYIQFIAPGVIAMTVLFNSIFSGIELFWDRQFGFLKETLISPTPRYMVMLGRTLGGATTAMIQGLMVAVVCVAVGFRFNSIYTLPMAVVFLSGIAITFTALGTAIASLLNDFQGFQLVINCVVMPIFFLSGAIFPLDNLPRAMAVVSDLDPLSYGVDGLRATLNGAAQAHFGIGTDLVVLCVLASVLLALGSWLFSRIQL